MRNLKEIILRKIAKSKSRTRDVVIEIYILISLQEHAFFVTYISDYPPTSKPIGRVNHIIVNGVLRRKLVIFQTENATFLAPHYSPIIARSRHWRTIDKLPILDLD